MIFILLASGEHDSCNPEHAVFKCKFQYDVCSPSNNFAKDCATWDFGPEARGMIFQNFGPIFPDDFGDEMLHCPVV